MIVGFGRMERSMAVELEIKGGRDEESVRKRLCEDLRFRNHCHLNGGSFTKAHSLS